MAAGEVGRRRERETAEENNETTNLKQRKLEEVETRILSPCVQETNRGGIVSDTSAVEEQCHQIPNRECDLLESASSSSVSCCSSNYRSDHDACEFDLTENVGSAAMEMEEVESCGMKKQKKR